MEQDLFKSSLGRQLTPTEVIGEIINFMRADNKRSYKIIIGTDSEIINNNMVDFVTAIVVHRVGNGGRYFYRRNKFSKIHTLRDRMWREVLLSIDVAKDFMELIKNFEIPSFDFEIHVDIGENGKTSTMIQELVGVIRANNFEAKTKPNSFAASSVADRHNSRHG